MSSGKLCKACTLLESLERGAAKLAVGAGVSLAGVQNIENPQLDDAKN
jgi:hypothetical protein